jgi:multiple antibiotic resistance protein
MPLELPTNFDAPLHNMVQAIVTVLAVINPVVCGSIFLTLTPKLAVAQRRWAAVKVALSILIILVTSALVGLKVLAIFNISLDVFRIVGGMIIAHMGFDMLTGRHTVGQAPPPDDDVNAQSSLAPLIMFAAGPGTITAVVTMAAVHTPDRLPLTAIAARSDRRRSNVRRLASCHSDGGASWAEHTGHSHPLYGAYCGVYGNAVRTGGPEGVLAHLARPQIDWSSYV